MVFGIQITRKFAVRLAMFMAVIAAALILDNYFGNNPEELKKIHAESPEQSSTNGNV